MVRTPCVQSLGFHLKKCAPDGLSVGLPFG
jgi:hypothetical protein